MTAANRDQVEGNWNQIKGRAKAAWAELTDDDVRRAEGSVDRLYGIIQEKFGESKESIQRRIEEVHL